MSDKLLNCPFCGSEPKVKRIGNEHTKRRSIEVKCSGSLCRASQVNAAIHHDFKWLQDVSIKAWNNRGIENE